MSRDFIPLLVLLVVAAGVTACGSDASPSGPSPASAGSAGASGASAVGGAAGSLATGSGGGGVGVAGAASVPPGQLVCGGKQCKGFGRCDPGGGCPAFLGECFTAADRFENCSAYCSARNETCAAQSCGPDGSPYAGGFTWTSFPASRKAECSTSSAPPQSSIDPCTSLIWLSPSKPQDDVVRCCCRE